MKKLFLIFSLSIILFSCKKEMPDGTYIGYFTYDMNGEETTQETEDLRISQPSDEELIINSSTLSLDKNNVSGELATRLSGTGVNIFLEGKVKKSIIGKYSIKGTFHFTIGGINYPNGTNDPQPWESTITGKFVIKKP